MIVTGQPGILSGGYDLKVMRSSPQNAIDLVTSGSRLARRMLSHPRPIIVACPGHAVAKGAFILLSADYRVGVDGPFTIGLNEVQIGMTMHHVGIELARDRLRKSAFQRAVINAEMFDPQGAREAGFLDRVVAPEALMSAALAMAQQLKKIDPKAHARTKLKVRKALLDALDQAIELDSTTSLFDADCHPQPEETSMEKKFNAPVDKVFGLLTDPKWLEARCLATGRAERELQDEEDPPGAATVTMKRRVRRELSAVISKVLNPESDIELVEQWAVAKHSRSGTLRAADRRQADHGDGRIRTGAGGQGLRLSHPARCQGARAVDRRRGREVRHGADRAGLRRRARLPCRLSEDGQVTPAWNAVPALSVLDFALPGTARASTRKRAAPGAARRDRDLPGRHPAETLAWSHRHESHRPARRSC